MDKAPQRKWDVGSRSCDFITVADGHRLGPHKRRRFAEMHGTILMVTAGTGNDFRFFPPDRSVLAIGISPKMIERARGKAANYGGKNRTA